MNHLDTTLTINIDSMLKYCLKCEAAEKGMNLSQLIRTYIFDGFDKTSWGKEYKCWWQMRDYEENPNEYRTDSEAIGKAMEEIENKLKEKQT